MRRICILSVLILLLGILAVPEACAESSWTCAKCGRTLTSAFCPDDGTPRSSAQWTCRVCGKVLTSAFCPDDGTAREAAAPAPDVRVGQSLFFGKYEQDNNRSNGAEKIEWTVLDVRNGAALLISRYCLDGAVFHSSQTAVTWAGSDLRRWLNDTFFYEAFSSAEQRAVRYTSISTPVSAYGNRSGGPDTSDYVFCLSSDEAARYFSSDSARAGSLTAYAASRAWNSWWWLRSPGGETDAAKAIVNADGLVTTGGNWVNNNHSVRPCIWVDLSRI